MWPRLLDMEEKECRSVLRRLELEAYSSIISAFRAQGDLTPEKKNLLRSVASSLSISTERHKAEVRRAVNDEKLTTIAERVAGEVNSLEWSVEGRRLVPLMPRFIPQTAYTVTANQVANMAHAHNATLPNPEDTAKKEGDESKASSESSGENNYIVLPPGTVLPKSSLDLQQLDEQAKQRHAASSSASYTSSPASFLSALTSGKLSSHSSSSSEGRSKGRSSSGSSAAPSTMKITFTKVGSGTTPTTSHATQKQVIIMSSANADQSPPSEVPSRPQGLPASTKVTMATMSEGHPPFQMTYEDQLTGIVTPYPPVSKHHRKGSKHKGSKPFTIIQQTPGPGMSTLTSSAYSMQSTSSGSGAPMVMGGKRAGMAPQRPEPGMKLITQTVASSSGRLSSKTYQVSASSATPSVRTTTIGVQAPRSSVTTGSQSTGLGARNIVTSPGPRIVTVPSQMGGRPQSSTSNVITLSPMSLQKTPGKNTTTTVVVTKPGAVMPGKTNVIVVQKSQIKSKMISSPRSATPGIMTHTTSMLTRPKIAMSMTGGVGGSGSPNPPSSSSGAMGMHSIRFPSPPTSSTLQKTMRGPSSVSMGGVMGGVTAGRGQSPVQAGVGSAGKSQGLVRSKSPIAQSMTMLSADLDPHTKTKSHRRSSAGSLGQGSSKVVVEEVPGGVMRSSSLGRDPSLIFQSSIGKPNTEWIDYDGSPPASQSASSAIKALLEIRGQPLPPATQVKHVPFSGVSPGLPPSSGTKQSTVTRRISSTSTTSAFSEQSKELSQSSTVITIEPKAAASSAERLEFSSDQLSSVVDQFEQFLESENLEGSKQSSKEEPERRPSESREQKEEETPKIDPFEFVEEIISKESEPSVLAKPRPSFGQEISKTAVMEKSHVIGHKISIAPQVTSGGAQPSQPPGTAASVASVVMESASSFDITQMNLEDLSCQRMREDEDDEEEGDEEKRGDDLGSSSEMMSFIDTSSGGSGSEGVMGSDGSLRVSRRKRKAPTPIDEETGPSSMPSWARAAWNLLQRVMRFRGANRPKGGINAASWFTRPVDPLEAPGYHKVIKKPMDFGTIKRNLEAATYQDFNEFHHDMMLVRGNCLQYNPPGHAARKDCEEVFQFYTSEYSKTLDRWQKFKSRSKVIRYFGPNSQRTITAQTMLQQLLSMPKSPKRIRADPPAAVQSPTPQ